MQRARAVGGGERLDVPRRQQVRERVQRPHVVLGDEHGLAGERLRPRRRCAARGRQQRRGGRRGQRRARGRLRARGAAGRPRRQGEAERAAGAELALDDNLAAQQRREVPDDVEAQPAAAEPARRS